MSLTRVQCANHGQTYMLGSNCAQCAGNRELSMPWVQGKGKRPTRPPQSIEGPKGAVLLGINCDGHGVYIRSAYDTSDEKIFHYCFSHKREFSPRDSCAICKEKAVFAAQNDYISKMNTPQEDEALKLLAQKVNYIKGVHEAAISPYCVQHKRSYVKGAWCPECRDPKYGRDAKSVQKYIDDVSRKFAELKMELGNNYLEKIAAHRPLLPYYEPRVEPPRGPSDFAPQPKVDEPATIFWSAMAGSALLLLCLFAVAGTWKTIEFWPVLLSFLAVIVWIRHTILTKWALDAKRTVLNMDWIHDGRLPHDIAEELRTYRLGRRLVEMGIKQECTLESLSDEASLWEVSYPHLAIDEKGTIELGKRAYTSSSTRSEPLTETCKCQVCGESGWIDDQPCEPYPCNACSKRLGYVKPPRDMRFALKFPYELETIALKDGRGFQRGFQVALIGLITSTIVFSVIVPLVVHVLFPN